MPISDPVKKAIELVNLYSVKSILEIGCGRGGILAQFNVPIKVGVDNFTPFMEYATQTYPTDDVFYLKYDVRKLSDIFLPRSFDVVMGFDILEHLPAGDMYDVIGICEKLARKLIIFFSPLDELGLAYPPEIVEGNNGMQHVTIIREQFFKDNSYKTITWPKYHATGATAMLAIKEL